MIRQLRVPQVMPHYLLAGTCLLASFNLLSNNLPPIALSPQKSIARPGCQQIVQPKAALSRQQLAQLLSVPERSPRESVRAIVKQPYCQLSSLTIRSGAATEREVYPLAFDPQTSLVVLYEGDNYVGYGFKRN